MGAGLGRALERGAAHAGAPAGGLRRLPDPHRCADRPRPLLTRRTWARWTTRSSWSSPTTGPAPKGARPAASTSTASLRTSGSPWTRTSPHYDDWGGFTTYNHYSWAWAWAGNTPHKLWKRYTWLGGTRTPLIVHWPGRIARPGAMRAQFAHVIDLMPTIMAAAGLDIPDEVDGVAQQPVDGVSLLSALEDPATPELHPTQYFEMMGSRSIYHEGWKATTNHISSGILDEEELAVGSRNFDDDRWELFDLSVDFSEATDRADEEPERLQRLRDLWDAEAHAQQRPSHLRRPGRPLRGVHPADLARRQRAHVPSRRWSRCRRVGPDAVGWLRHHSRHRCRRRRCRWGRVRPRRLVRRLRPLPRRRPGALHLRPGRRHARAGHAVRPRRRPAHHHGVVRSRARAGRRDGWSCWSTAARSTRPPSRACCPSPSSTAGRRCASGGTAASPCRALRAACALQRDGARGAGGHARHAAARPGRRGPRRAPRRLTGRGGLPWPQSSCGTPASMLSSPRLHDPGAAPSAAARAGQALQQRVHGRRHAVQATFERYLPVEEVGLDRPRAAGQALPARSPCHSPEEVAAIWMKSPRRSRSSSELATAMPAAANASLPSRWASRASALNLAFGPGQCFHRVGEVHEELAVLPAHDVGAGHGLEGGRRDGVGDRPAALVDARRESSDIEEPRHRCRVQLHDTGLQLGSRAHHTDAIGVRKVAQDAALVLHAVLQADHRCRRRRHAELLERRGPCSDPSRPAAPPGRRRRQPPRTPPPAPQRREWAG